MLCLPAVSTSPWRFIISTGSLVLFMHGRTTDWKGWKARREGGREGEGRKVGGGREGEGRKVGGGREMEGRWGEGGREKEGGGREGDGRKGKGREGEGEGGRGKEGGREGEGRKEEGGRKEGRGEGNRNVSTTDLAFFFLPSFCISLTCMCSIIMGIRYAHCPQ